MEKEEDSPRRISSSHRPCSRSNSNSPEFEFWMLQNPSFPEPNLVSADELIVDGYLLPLHLLHLHPPPHPPPTLELPNSQPPIQTEPPGPGPGDQAPSTASKRWTDIFTKTATSTAKKRQDKELNKEKKRDKKSQSGSSSSTELNINLWPFSRSRSAGNSSGNRGSRMFPATGRKVSSAPCSRSNSAGESKSRKWPSSPGRTGVHLGRSSPVWQVRRGPSHKTSSSSSLNYSSSADPIHHPTSTEQIITKKQQVTDAGHRNGRAKAAKVVNLNVPTMCIEYSHHLSCRSHEGVCSSSEGRNRCTRNRTANVATSRSRTSASTSHLLNLRSLFTKKVY